jgi:3D (Asp-Asp-Asp) domain-containing protein
MEAAAGQTTLRRYAEPLHPVTIIDSGTALPIQTAASTVGAALAEMSVMIGALDRVVPPRSAALRPGTMIQIVRVRRLQIQEEVFMAFETEHVPDPTLAAGQTRRLQVGRAGKRLTTYTEIYEDGQPIGRERLASAIAQPPVKEVIGYGLAGLASRGAPPANYKRTMTMVATAYAIGDGMTPGTHTFLGLPAKRGVVAVDPKVIPLGTRLYIEGYGEALAADTGGAIKGNKIDLCFDSIAEVYAFGLKKVKVYILE